MTAYGDRARASGETEADPSAGGGATSLLTIGAIAAGVVLMSVVQFRFVLQLALSPVMFVLPTLVGVTFGALVALIRAARRRERSTARQLAAAQQARFEAMQRLAGGVGHDLGNVFAVAAACSGCVRQLAERSGGAGPCAKCVDALQDLDAALERARGISRQLVMLARPPGRAEEPADTAAVIRGIAPMLRRVAGAAVRLEVAAEEAVHVRIDRTELEQLALNLAANARDAMPEGGTLRVRVAREGAAAVLAVRDTGVGMDAVTCARMFEPFFTTKAPGKGTGLGLMVVARVVERAGGRIAVRSAPGEGTEVAISFPAVDVVVVGAARAV
jgi:signal transduction histidine kinase